MKRIDSGSRWRRQAAVCIVLLLLFTLCGCAKTEAPEPAPTIVADSNDTVTEAPEPAPTSVTDSNDTVTEALEPAPTTVTDSNNTVTEVTVLPESTENTDAQTELPAEPDSQMTATTEETPVKTELILKIDGQKVSVTWEDNESVTALRKLAAKAPITIQMSMYGGFEQVGPIGTSLPRSDVQTTTEAGDIVLYSGSQIVVFYGSNSWAYTRLGRIGGLNSSELTSLLGNGAVELILTAE